MPLISCKVKLKLKWTKYCVLSVVGTNNIIFAIKDTKLYALQKLSKFLSKGFQRSLYWTKFKTKSENKILTNEFTYILESNFIAVKGISF